MSFRALHVIPSATRNLPLRTALRVLGGCTNMSFRALHVIPSTTRNLPPSLRVRGLGGCSYPPFAKRKGPGGCTHTSFSRRRESRGDGKGKSWQSWFKTSPFAARKGARGMHQHVILAQAGIQSGWERDESPFAFTPCHSEHSEESLTSFSRRRESRGEGKGKSWQSFPHHGNHGSKPPPFAFTPCHSEHSEESLTSFLTPFPRRRPSRTAMNKQ